MFQGSLKYAPLCIMKPIAIIFKIASKRKMIKRE